MAEEKREVVTAENWGKSRTDGIEVVAEKTKDIGELTYKLSLDVSEALTGLKAVQREAREATKALRELEAAQQPKVAEVMANYLPISSEDAEKVVQAIMQGRHKGGHVFPYENVDDVIDGSDYVFAPIMTHPNTAGDIPEHVRKYGTGSGSVTTTSNRTQPRAWFKDGGVK
ncbi:hypothetical protein [Cytobacillus purgationiresistens]|uniref:Glycerol-3-phosphate dehydrogenase n=1 Tax=Cytobacillus purgationiresistens TaxID=863449 RepID=A0ABU0AHK8_9BACI|nr:hypothetical protein [Cytobacillus purgationiresistens]MDQ0270743.1 glycerol-3-phosphate dehydrogenase [Cytobacillus purgationiresistens]